MITSRAMSAFWITPVVTLVALTIASPFFFPYATPYLIGIFLTVATFQIFGWSMKGIAFNDDRIVRRIQGLAKIFPHMDHARTARPHLSTHRGGNLPREPYTGRLVFGPEKIAEFNERSAREIPHIKLDRIIA